MIKNLTVIILVITYAFETQAAKMAYHSHEEIDFISAPEVNSPEHWKESSSLQHGRVEIITNLHLLQAKQNSPSPSDLNESGQPSKNSNQNLPNPAAGIDVSDKQPIEWVVINTEKTTVAPLVSQIHFDLLSESQDLVSQFIGINVNLDTVVEGTVNLVLQINAAWNDLDDQIAYELYQSLGYIGVSSAFLQGNYLSDQPSANNLKEALRNLGGPAEIENYVEPEGFFGLILKLPKFFTLNNFIILMGLMLAGNGVFRAIRYIVIRI